MVKVTRTMNNTLIVGETTETKDKVVIENPYSMIPVEDGIKLIPIDVNFIGVIMEKIELTQDKVFYTSEVSKVIEEEYHKYLEAQKNPPQESQETETETK